MRSKFLSIGALSKVTGCKIPTIRYYEDIGLLHPPQRTEGNQRRYSPAHLKQLKFIRHARELGFNQEEIRELVSLAEENEHCRHADKIAEKHLREVELKISRLILLREELKLMLNSCQESTDDRCKVIEVLSDHTLCQHEH